MSGLLLDCSAVANVDYPLFGNSSIIPVQLDQTQARTEQTNSAQLIDLSLDSAVHLSHSHTNKSYNSKET